MRQFEKLLSPQRRTPVGYDVERIVGNEVGPVRRHAAQTAGAVIEPSPVLTPVLTTRDQIEFLRVQRVMWVPHPERSALNVTMRRS